ncbi:hypothetical protein BT96DRAFT_1007959 [Gymnopus androsaceus JB14]|uniref:Uncharacterized protein n=1 Tax=Gymnopus androsaceus JB14 TaxID=1447944 RepID=A0A6A4GGF2_9AGAR|nr:hypothetical protein BT96DRAFT_1007959 [Gymnopus androsaceus JB14]
MSPLSGLGSEAGRKLGSMGLPQCMLNVQVSLWQPLELQVVEVAAEQERFTMHYFKRDSCSGEIAFDAEKANSAALQAKLDSIAKEHGNL